MNFRESLEQELHDDKEEKEKEAKLLRKLDSFMNSMLSPEFFSSTYISSIEGHISSKIKEQREVNGSTRIWSRDITGNRAIKMSSELISFLTEQEEFPPEKKRSIERQRDYLIERNLPIIGENGEHYGALDSYYRYIGDTQGLHFTPYQGIRYSKNMIYQKMFSKTFPKTKRVLGFQKHLTVFTLNQFTKDFFQHIENWAEENQVELRVVFYVQNAEYPPEIAKINDQYIYICYPLEYRKGSLMISKRAKTHRYLDKKCQAEYDNGTLIKASPNVELLIDNDHSSITVKQTTNPIDDYADAFYLIPEIHYSFKR